MDSQFRADMRTHVKTVIIDLYGDLSNQSEEGLLGLREWELGLGQNKRFLILNFTQVPYINSMGIAVLIRIVRSLMKTGCQTFAYGVTPHYQKLFRMVGLTEYIMIYPDEYSILQRIETIQE
ncbi:STAS domain-containing protein [Paenibacillus validus]|uniref:STAS domain-containing protein n=1 Tax=Paenibacillus TaxID=44249 RepID=UPI0006CF4BB1|nr:MULTISPECIES: STAS domain-containing protein [Paenibacillus]MED4600131.1 STAS domain-containing protein [Paenibacillus validus]MED4607697.1 STAS domain-containing protein [Paenibacillus validus]